MRRLTVLFSLVFAASAFVLLTGASQAQYPSPIGSATATTSEVNPPTGESVLLTCEVRDESGSPVAGAPCVFSIESEPGDDAAVGSKVVMRMTDESGKAYTNLYTGSTAGVILVKIQAGELSSVVLIDVAPADAPPPAAPIEITPPNTGDGGLSEQLTPAVSSKSDTHGNTRPQAKHGPRPRAGSLRG